MSSPLEELHEFLRLQKLQALAKSYEPRDLPWESLPLSLQTCKECKSKTEPRWHEGAGTNQWFCSNSECWMSK